MTDLGTCAALMSQFARRTGIEGVEPQRRYLWTDAFAVCNFLELYDRTGEPLWLARARRLADLVHGVLGRHHPDDPRRGWISGLGDREGPRHPTAGGLRIGKRYSDTDPSCDDEWNRDGQYFHYLTRWMHALLRLGRVTGEADYDRWAAELAETAVRSFVRRDRGGRVRMVWKMSVDLARPLVASMGQHDALDGLLTLHEIRAAAVVRAADRPGIGSQISLLSSMCGDADWSTVDLLGIGGLLADAGRIVQLSRRREEIEVALLECVLRAALVGLTTLERRGELPTKARPARERLAFRELGLSIGLSAVPLVLREADSGEALSIPPAVGSLLDGLERFLPLGADVREFWLDEQSQAVGTWEEHLDINAVMLATSLAPAGYLTV